MIKQTRSAASGSVRMVGRTGLRGLLFTGLCAGLAACAGGGGSATRPDDAASGAPAALERRAVERWQLLIEGKPEEAYEYLTPGYRSTMGRQEYTRSALMGAIKWNSVAWRDAECSSADACKVRLQVGYSVRMSGAGDVPSINMQEESWLLTGGQWYFLPAK